MDIIIGRRYILRKGARRGMAPVVIVDAMTGHFPKEIRVQYHGVQMGTPGGDVSLAFFVKTYKLEPKTQQPNPVPMWDYKIRTHVTYPNAVIEVPTNPMFFWMGLLDDEEAAGEAAYMLAPFEVLQIALEGTQEALMHYPRAVAEFSTDTQQFHLRKYGELPFDPDPRPLKLVMQECAKASIRYATEAYGDRNIPMKFLIRHIVRSEPMTWKNLKPVAGRRVRPERAPKGSVQPSDPRRSSGEGGSPEGT